MTTYFHYTPLENIESILQSGLKPRNQLEQFTSFTEKHYGLNMADPNFVYLFGSIDPIKRSLEGEEDKGVVLEIQNPSNITRDHDYILWILNSPLDFVSKALAAWGEMNIVSKEEAIQLYFSGMGVDFQGPFTHKEIVNQIDEIPSGVWQNYPSSYRTEEIIVPSCITVREYT